MALIQVFNQGKAKAIGVSNFEQVHLEDLFELNTLIPSVNQVEFHPYFHEDALVQFCKAHKILYNGYSSVGVPDHMGSSNNPGGWQTQIIQQPLVQNLAQKYNKTVGQIVLAWSWQQGIVVNARSWNPQHQIENLNFFDIQFTPAEMLQLGSMPLPPDPKVCADSRGFY